MTPWPGPRETISQFEKPLVALAQAGVDFALVGGLAVILNGYPRVTLDVDLIVSPDPENVRRLLQALDRLPARTGGATLRGAVRGWSP